MKRIFVVWFSGPNSVSVHSEMSGRDVGLWCAKVWLLLTSNSIPIEGLFALSSVCSYIKKNGKAFVATHLSRSWRTFCIFNGLNLNEEKALTDALCIGENTLAGGNVTAFFNGSFLIPADFDVYVRKTDLAASLRALKENYLLIIPENPLEVPL